MPTVTHRSRKLTDEQVQAIRSQPHYRGLVRALAAHYGVSRWAVSNARLCRTYRGAGHTTERLEAAAKAGETAMAEGQGWRGAALAIIETYARYGKAAK